MYPSKILIFGEYTILLNSHALAIPYDRYGGEWAFMDNQTDNAPEEAHQSNLNLKQLLADIKSGEKYQNAGFSLDVKALEKDLENGLYYKSLIPQGIGLGSSGALVAAVFDRYVKFGTGDSEIHNLKNYLASLESLYHLNSSGIDPLVSYLKSPVLITGKEKIEKLNFPVNYSIKKYGLFLVNSQYSRNTGPLVNYFKHKCNTDLKYLDKINKNYIPVNNECVQEFISNNHPEIFFSKIKVLTNLQLDLFKEMIPENLASEMKYGQETSLFYLKLCGSGGGGYYLGFTGDTLKTEAYFKARGHNTIFLR